MKALALLAVVTVLAAGCGSARDEPMSVADAAAASGEVTVEGALVGVQGQPVRLCSALMESYPPQCGGPALEVRGLDLDSLDGLSSTRPGDDVAPARWSDRPVRLTGTVEDGVLTVDS